MPDSRTPRFFPLCRAWFLLAAGLACWTSAHAAVEVACHRMDNNRFTPENTWAAARRAVAMGYHYIEVDVRTSLDGVMYIIHDPYVDRTTDGTGALSEMASAEIDRLDAGAWFGEEFRGEKVPRLEPFLRWAKGKVKLYLDPKDADLGELVRLVREIGFEDEACYFWPYAWDMAEELRRLDPELYLIVNVRTLEGARRARDELGAQMIGILSQELTPELIAFCHGANMRVMVHEMRLEPDVFRRIIELGADLVNLDHPEIFLKMQEEITGVPAPVPSCPIELARQPRPESAEYAPPVSSASAAAAESVPEPEPVAPRSGGGLFPPSLVSGTLFIFGLFYGAGLVVWISKPRRRVKKTGEDQTPPTG